MTDYLRKLARDDVTHGRGPQDMSNATAREKEVHDAARAAALQEQNKK